jgi:hypothetical protein
MGELLERAIKEAHKLSDDEQEANFRTRDHVPGEDDAT